MRGTTRDPARTPAIEAAGAEPFLADPDRIATLMPALDHVAVACVLFGSATGPAVAELHGPRLEMLLRRLLDTTVHGVVYEGPAGGLVRRTCERSRIAYALLDGARYDHDAWLEAALAAVESLL